MTLSENYHRDREAVQHGYDNAVGKRIRGTLDEVDQVWRTYQKALFHQLTRRSLKRIGTPLMRNRRADGDDELPLPFGPRWNAASDEELLDLYDTLIEANYRGPRKRKKKVSED